MIHSSHSQYALILLPLLCVVLGQPLVSSYIDWSAAKPQDLCTLPVSKPKLLFIPDSKNCLSIFLDTYCNSFARVDISKYGSKEDIWKQILLYSGKPLILYGAPSSVLGGFTIQWKQCFDPKVKSFTFEKAHIDCSQLVLITTSWPNSVVPPEWQTFMRTLSSVSPAFHSQQYTHDFINDTLQEEFSSHTISRAVFGRDADRVLGAYASYSNAKLPMFTCTEYAQISVAKEMKKIASSLQQSLREKSNTCRRFFYWISIPFGEELNPIRWKFEKPFFLSADVFFGIHLGFVTLFMIFKISERWNRSLKSGKKHRKHHMKKKKKSKNIESTATFVVESEKESEKESSSSRIRLLPVSEPEMEQKQQVVEKIEVAPSSAKKQMKNQRAEEESEEVSSGDETEEEVNQSPPPSSAQRRSFVLLLLSLLSPVHMVMDLLSAIVGGILRILASIVYHLGIVLFFEAGYVFYLIFCVLYWHYNYHLNLDPDLSHSDVVGKITLDFASIFGNLLQKGIAGFLKGSFSWCFDLLKTLS